MDQPQNIRSMKHENIVEIADRLGITLTAHKIGDELQDPIGAWHTRYGLEAGGAVLIRPDSVIAWRSITAATNPVQELEEALTAILTRTPVSSAAQ